jgi:HD-GYP domain-containing protein (c-di-GMP phosphodiesterase class II)
MPARLEDSLRSGVDAFVAAIDAHDPCTAAHSDQVARLAAEVGLRMGLEPRDALQLELAARLHDVGKILIPNRILRKPRALSDVEWGVIRLHPIWGAVMLAPVPGLEPVAAVVRWHHERWDGAGYPDRVGAHGIPLHSRVIAVCDAYETMTSRRPYRGALSHDGALRELELGAGTQFDPEVVEVATATLGELSRERASLTAA